MADPQVFSLKGKNVAITGAAGSIGTQTALLFAKSGASTLLLSDVSSDALDKLHQTFRLNAPLPETRLIFHACDVTDEKSVADLIAQLDQFDGVDVMINNAGVFPTHVDGDAVGVDAEAWELTHKVNVLGTWLGSKHAVLSMRRHHKKKGSIINISSVAGLVGSATAQLAYTASKGAVIAMTRELGIVHAREGYRFNCVCPGPLNSPMLNEFLDAEDEPVEGVVAGSSRQMGRRERREIHLPQGRFGEPAEVAAASLFLASDASAFVNSTELVVDGGLTKVSPFAIINYARILPYG
ncbi:Putative short-chain dehydrogenase reductase family [Tolypocladium paradoxum]|uniref:Short-chain dehydrogenase reductase family n=1 Tax=Tolypocladium paradoxum TaxID=94208 RepID=A0A2S4KQH4_9HYPO|nr:Putative short-chain dehydrogenase reductase family [Tolypocladium paradoxum]